MTRGIATLVLLGAVALGGTARADLPLAFVPIASVTATSTYADPHGDYAPSHVLIYDVTPQPLSIKRAWCEGKPDEGLGEAVTITLAEPTVIDSLSVAAGVWRNAALFAANNQVTKLEVIADGASQMIAPGAFGDRWVEAPIKRRVTTIVLKVAAVKKGKMNDSCIAAVDLMVGGARLAPIVGGDVAQLAALRTSVSAIEKALEDPARKGLEAQLEFPFSSQDYFAVIAGRTDKRASTKIFKLANWAAVAKECAAYDAAVTALGDGAGTVSLRGCPGPAAIDSDRPAAVRTLKSGWIEVVFPSHHEVGQTWTLHWNGTRWKLAAIGTG